jgi:hypothetical protein
MLNDASLGQGENARAGATPAASDYRQRRLLRARRERPRRRAAKQRYELAPLHVWMAPALQEKM